MLTREQLLEHIAAGDRQADVARVHGVSRTRITQLKKLYALDWPTPVQHQHGPGLWPHYRPGCPECQAIVRAAGHKRRQSQKESA